MVSRVKVCVLSVFLLCFICACAKEADEPLDKPVEAVDYQTLYKEETVNDPISDDWSREETEKIESSMLMAEYISNVFPKTLEGKTFQLGYASDRENIYALRQYFKEDEYNIIALDTFNANTKSSTEIQYEYGEKSGLYGIPTDLYAVNGRVFASTQKHDSDGLLTEMYVTEFLGDGMVTTFPNVYHVLEDNDWIPEENYMVADASSRYEPATGYTYVLSPSKDKMIICDETGEVQKEFTGFNEEDKSHVSFYATTQFGFLIFLCEQKNKETFFVYDNGEIEILYEGESGAESDGAYQIVDGHGRILFLKNNTTIVSWDTVAGTQETLYKGGGNNLYSDIEAFTRNDKGEILVLSEGNVRVISYEGNLNPVEITIKTLFASVGNDLKDCVNRYVNTHPGVKITILPGINWDSRDAEISKVYADISKGDGPDLLVVDDNQLMDLLRSDSLYDLTGVLKPEVAAALVPAVRNDGLLNNKKYRMGVTSSLLSFVVNKKYCKGDSLSISDILDEVEERERQGNPFECIAVGPNSYGNLLDVLIYTIAESEFVDMDNHKCTFDSEEFIRLLKICKKYGDTSIHSEEAGLKALKEDRALLYVGDLDIVGFSNAFATLGSDYRTIGYPMKDNENRNILMFSVGGVAVNKSSMEDVDKERVIKDFLNCMYTPDYLVDNIAFMIPARIDAYEGRIDRDEYFDSLVIQIDTRSFMPIASKEDGTSHLDEYLELLNSCDNLSLKHVGTIKGIIAEETEAFFAGASTAEEVARVIQSRVSLFLMELE